MLNLDVARRQAERHMLDNCRISVRSTPPQRNWTLGVDGHLEAPAGDTSVIYDGRCLLSGGGRQSQPSSRSEGDRDVVRPLRRLRLPHDAPMIPHGSSVEMTAVGDAARSNLVGLRFRVESTIEATYSATRLVTMYPDDPPERT